MRKIQGIEEVLKVNTEILANYKYKQIFKQSKTKENQKINNINQYKIKVVQALDLVTQAITLTFNKNQQIKKQKVPFVIQ